MGEPKCPKCGTLNVDIIDEGALWYCIDCDWCWVRWETRTATSGSGFIEQEATDGEN